MTGEQAPIRVLIVDDQALLRGSFRSLIDSAADLTVVGDAANGAQAVDLVGQCEPDVVLMDVRMPEMDGIEATRLICAAQAERRSTRVLMLTTFDLDEHVYAALQAGASGFLLKDTPPAELLSAIRVVAGGDGLLAPTVTRRLIERFGQPRSGPVRHERLAGITEREREVLTLIGSGLSNDEIAARFTLSMPTVKTHVGRLLAKLQARDRAQLVIAAYESGLVEVGDRGGGAPPG